MSDIVVISIKPKYNSSKENIVEGINKFVDKIGLRPYVNMKDFEEFNELEVYNLLQKEALDNDISFIVSSKKDTLEFFEYSFLIMREVSDFATSISNKVPSLFQLIDYLYTNKSDIIYIAVICTEESPGKLKRIKVSVEEFKIILLKHYGWHEDSYFINNPDPWWLDTIYEIKI